MTALILSPIIALRDLVFPKYPKKPANVNAQNANILYFYNGAITTEFMAPNSPQEGMRFRQTISSTDPITCKGRYGEGTPPHHYHPCQTEYFEIESGIMGYVCDGTERIARAGEKVSILPGQRHTWWVHVDAENPQDLVVVLSAAPDNGMDEAWFRNLYAAIENGPKRFPHILHMFVLLDAGDVILADPPKPIGWLLNVILGRFIGQYIAGYRPYENMYTYPSGKPTITNQDT